MPVFAYSRTCYYVGGRGMLLLRPWLQGFRGVRFRVFRLRVSGLGWFLVPRISGLGLFVCLTSGLAFGEDLNRIFF